MIEQKPEKEKRMSSPCDGCGKSGTCEREREVRRSERSCETCPMATFCPRGREVVGDGSAGAQDDSYLIAMTPFGTIVMSEESARALGFIL